VVLYTEAVRVSPKDPTFIFNLAQVGHVRIHKWIHAAIDGRADGFEDGVLSGFLAVDGIYATVYDSTCAGV